MKERHTQIIAIHDDDGNAQLIKNQKQEKKEKKIISNCGSVINIVIFSLFWIATKYMLK